MANQWTEKYIREQPFMAFGSLLNGYAQMHQQKPVELKQFKKDAEELFSLSQKLVLVALKSSETKVEGKQSMEPDIPL